MAATMKSFAGAPVAQASWEGLSTLGSCRLRGERCRPSSIAEFRRPWDPQTPTELPASHTPRLPNAQRPTLASRKTVVVSSAKLAGKTAAKKGGKAAAMVCVDCG